ncbi:hypothetical protein ACFX2I_031038 [Malus domestica]
MPMRTRRLRTSMSETLPSPLLLGTDGQKRRAAEMVKCHAVPEKISTSQSSFEEDEDESAAWRKEDEAELRSLDGREREQQRLNSIQCFDSKG